MRRPSPGLLPLLILALGASGCGRDEIKTYRVAKEPAAVPAPALDTSDRAMANTAVTTASGPGLRWTAPASWSVGPANPKRKATYLIPGEAGATAELAITAFPGDVGGRLANVNRWRNELSLPPIAASELDAALQHLHVGDFHIDVVELVSPGTPPAKRVISALVPHDNSTWFFKLTGPDALVASEKAAFIAFLQTLRPQS